MQLEVGHGSSVTTGLLHLIRDLSLTGLTRVAHRMGVSWTSPIQVLSLPPDVLQNSPEFSDLTHSVSKYTNTVDHFLINKI